MSTICLAVLQACLVRTLYSHLCCLRLKKRHLTSLDVFQVSIKGFCSCYIHRSAHQFLLSRKFYSCKGTYCFVNQLLLPHASYCSAKASSLSAAQNRLEVKSMKKKLGITHLISSSKVSIDSINLHKNIKYLKQSNVGFSDQLLIAVII